MGWFWDILDAMTFGLISNTFGRFNWLCTACEKNVSPEICKVQAGEPVWFDGHGGAIEVGFVCVVAAVVALAFGESIYLAAEGLGDFGKLALTGLEVLAWPVKECWRIAKWGFLEVFKVTDAIAEYTNTYPELWKLIAANLALLAVIEAGYEISKAAWDEPQDSYFWRTFRFLNRPVSWMEGLWLKTFASPWNPLRYAIYLPLLVAEFAIVILTLVVNVANPFYWWDKLKKQ